LFDGRFTIRAETLRIQGLDFNEVSKHFTRGFGYKIAAVGKGLSFDLVDFDPRLLMVRNSSFDMQGCTWDSVIKRFGCCNFGSFAMLNQSLNSAVKR